MNSYGKYGLFSIAVVLFMFTNCYRQNCSELYREEQTKQQVKVWDFKLVYYKKTVNYDTPIDKLMDSLQVNDSDLHILVDKSEYTLSLLAGTLLVKQYPVVLGRNPIDDKLRQGDCCTPEGNFRIKDKYKHEAWSRFIWIDYPNAESIKKIARAKKAGIISKDSYPGGEVGIHGVPANTDFLIDTRINWTAGCVSLKNKDINEIFKHVMVGTKVIIRK